MKSNKKLKIIGIALAVFILVFAGIMSYASSKLKPEEIKKIAIAQTEKIFPNAKADLESVNIKWGFNFKIELKKFLLQTKNEAGEPVELAYVDSLDLKVPLWAIITDGGVIEVQLDKPIVNYQEFSTNNNWTYALGNKDNDKLDEVTKKVEEDKHNPNPAIGLLAKSKINVRISDVLIKYFLKDKSNGQVTVSKFLVKGLNLKEATAFEIQTDAKFNMANQSVVTVSALAIGELNIAELVNKGEVSSLVIVKLNNIKKSDLKINFPEIVTNLNLLIKKTGEISGNLETTFEAHNKIAASFLVNKTIDLKNINVDISLKDVAQILGLNNGVDFSKSKLQASGALSLNETKNINADLNFSITPGIGLNVDGIDTLTSVQGSYKKTDINVKTKTSVFKGFVDTNIDGKFDLGEKFDLAKLDPFYVKIVAQKMNIPEKFIQQKLWAKNDGKAADQKEEIKKGEGKPSGGLALPPVHVDLNWSDILVAGENFQGKGKVTLNSKSLTVNDLKFNFSKGTGLLTQTMIFGEKSNHSVFNFDIKNLNLDSFKGFLPPFVENFKGIFSGKIAGNATLYKTADKAPSFDVNANLEAVNGEIKKLDLKSFILPLIQGLPILSQYAENKDLDVDGKFDAFLLKANFKTDAYSLNSVKFIGKNKKVEIIGNGTLHPKPGSSNSVMDVTYIDNGKIGDKVKQSIGARDLPVRVSGPGFSLKPDVGYTLGKIAKSAAETKGKEALNKVINKNLDKIIPESAKEQVKGILDGFLKKKK